MLNNLNDLDAPVSLELRNLAADKQLEWQVEKNTLNGLKAILEKRIIGETPSLALRKEVLKTIIENYIPSYFIGRIGYSIFSISFVLQLNAIQSENELNRFLQETINQLKFDERKSGFVNHVEKFKLLHAEFFSDKVPVSLSVNLSIDDLVNQLNAVKGKLRLDDYVTTMRSDLPQMELADILLALQLSLELNFHSSATQVEKRQARETIMLLDVLIKHEPATGKLENIKNVIIQGESLSIFVSNVNCKTRSHFSELLLATIQPSESLRSVLESNAAIQPPQELLVRQLPSAKLLGRSLMSALNRSDEAQLLVSEQQVDRDIDDSIPVWPEIALAETLSFENPATHTAPALRVVL